MARVSSLARFMGRKLAGLAVYVTGAVVFAGAAIVLLAQRVNRSRRVVERVRARLSGLRPRRPAVAVRGPVVVAVLDAADWRSNTDNIVVVDPDRQTVTWVPRDLWCAGRRDRVNAAFAAGGHRGLRSALAELDIRVDHGICLRRDAVERVLEDVDVTVPVDEPERLRYPVDPRRTMQEAGSRIITFEPPSERLNGLRVHEWIGARKGVDHSGSDLKRLRRQRVLVQRLLETGFDFAAALEQQRLVSLTSSAAVDTLREVDATWTFDVIEDVVARTIDGKEVLVRYRPG